MTIVTGWPGSGKSEWLDALLVNLCRQGWHIGMFSPENQPIELHASKWLEKITGKPFGRGPTERMTISEVAECAAKLDGWMRFLEPPRDGGVSAMGVVKAFESWFGKQEGPCGLVIDPWNELEHKRRRDETETDYIGRAIRAIKRFARRYNIAIWVIAHPVKPGMDMEKPPTLYSISGSSHWANKADYGAIVHRIDKRSPVTDLIMDKVRMGLPGQEGLSRLVLDRETSSYRQEL